MSASWKTLEYYVRHIAEVMWEVPFLPERIDGVNFDAIGRVSDEEIIVLEITEEHNLDKVRNDAAKILAFKMRMAAQSIVVRAFIVLKGEPTPGMVDIGKPDKIRVMSAASFSQQAFDFKNYVSTRLAGTFGSSIDPITGKPDPNSYIPVSYISHSGKSLSVSDVCVKLARKNRIVLLGEYGTGKSRCVREAFNVLSSSFEDASAYPLAINLREHWGAQSGVEIISGHFSRLGLSGSVDRAMKLLRNGSILLLLDGFDEVGTQTFGNSEERRASIRKHALSGVADLLSLSSGGALITGRPHYFDDNGELLRALGLSLRDPNTSIIECRQEFEKDQADAYLAALGIASTTPEWLPKKPLMFQIIASMEPQDAEKILKSHAGEIGFWGQFIDTVCIRESRMHPSIEADTVRNVLGYLARFTRVSDRELGRLTPKHIQEAYELATGYAPDESGNLMLSRLCTLGRIEPESPDRQFVDPYIVQLLFADSVVDDILDKNHEILTHDYKQPLLPLGLHFLAQWIETYDFEAECLAFIHRDSLARNAQILGELVTSLLLISGDSLDFGGTKIAGAELCLLELGNREITNIEFSDGILHRLSMSNCLVGHESRVIIRNMDILRISGLSSVSAIPTWVVDSNVKTTDNVSSSSRIKSSPLPASQKLFLSVIHKIFFQRGGGRKENSLYKGGFGQSFDRKIIDQILHKLVSEGVIEESKDSSGRIYNPKREFTARMQAIRDQLSLSKDPLWLDVALIKSR
ncbi:hypothetical protein SAMN05428966_11970 [Massilia sp. PDC64]|nr:hypothetical protein [Massilia sp. PDC64]SDF70051.1 hypothetical protein SAMN05428966_11970 [Massilia sp. PDC64]